MIIDNSSCYFERSNLPLLNPDRVTAFPSRQEVNFFRQRLHFRIDFAEHSF